MGFNFTCDLCGSAVKVPKHITGLSKGLLSVCPDCRKDLWKYAKHLKKKKGGN